MTIERDQKLQKLEGEVTYLREEIEEAVRLLSGIQAIVEQGQSIIERFPPANLLLANLHSFLKKHESAQRKQLWCVHVEGPNHAVPAPDQATAAKWAEAINEAARQYFARNPSPRQREVRAKPAPWPYSAEDHAVGPSDQYSWLLKVAAHE